MPEEYDVWRPPSSPRPDDEPLPPTHQTPRRWPTFSPGNRRASSSASPGTSPAPTYQPSTYQPSTYQPSTYVPPRRRRRRSRGGLLIGLFAAGVVVSGMRAIGGGVATHGAIPDLPSIDFPSVEMPGSGAADAPFTVDTFYPDATDGELDITVRADKHSPSHHVHYVRLAERALAGTTGCASIGAPTAVTTLRTDGCSARLVTTWRTTEGVELTGQVLRFRDDATARSAAAALRPADLLPTSGAGPADSEIKAQANYVVVTVADKVPPGVPADTLARSVGYLQAEVLTTIIWL